LTFTPREAYHAAIWALGPRDVRHEQQGDVAMSAITPGARPRTREETLAALAALAPALRALGVRSLGLFGSYARGEQRPHSDVDALVTFDRVTFRRYMDTKLLLEDTLGLPVDLALADDLRPRLRERALAEVIYVPGLSPLS
jgi:predicted nucleotidyltransferase